LLPTLITESIESFIDDTPVGKSAMARELAAGDERATDPDDDDEGSGLDPFGRRAYLGGLAGAATTAALAGCIGGDDSPPSDSITSGSAAFGYGGAPVLAMSASVATTAESEPNDDRSAATTLTRGVELSGELTTAEVDWFSLGYTAGDTMTVTFDRKNGKGTAALVVYAPDGSNLHVEYVGSSRAVTVEKTVPTDGTYFVQLVDVGDAEGSYTLLVEGGSSPDGGETTTPTATATPTPTETTTATPTPTGTPLPEDDYGEQGYGDLGYGGTA
jgi:hypothetical protein